MFEWTMLQMNIMIGYTKVVQHKLKRVTFTGLLEVTWLECGVFQQKYISPQYWSESLWLDITSEYKKEDLATLLHQ